MPIISTWQALSPRIPNWTCRGSSVSVMNVLSKISIALNFGKAFLLDRTFDCFKDKLSISTVIFIRSEDNLALLWLYVLLGISWVHALNSEHAQLPVAMGELLLVGNVWVKPLLCMCGGCWEESILRPGMLKRTLSHKWLRWYLPTYLFNNGLFTLM